MDFLRSCYATTMVFREGDDPVPVLWYFCDPGAKPHPVMTPFRSHNWQSRVDIEGALGEQPGFRGWTNGSKPANGGSGNQDALDCVNAILPAWEDGLAAGQETGPFDSQGFPICCKGPCCECAIPDTITARIFQPLCPCLDDIEITLTRMRPDCRWRGQLPGSCGGKPVDLEWEVITTEPECGAITRFLCDGVVVGDESNSWFCDDNGATTVINPLLNDCCSETLTIDIQWVPQ